MTEPKMNPDAAYDRARAAVLAGHRYRTDNATAMAHCECGETVAALDVGVHIERLAREAGEQARAAAQ